MSSGQSLELAVPGVTCPNCGERVPGLYSNSHGVLHCGCFYSGEPSQVCWHVTSMCSPENRSEWDPPPEA